MKIRSINPTYFCLVILLLFCIPIILPFFHAGYFPTHDGEWAVVRLTEMFREVRDLQIPPRYSGFLNFGYGYPLFNFAYPMPYYLGLFIHALGFDFVTSIKILFALTVPVSAIAMFFLSKNLWKSTFAGFLSSIFYLYYPYRMIDLYVRGSIGESLAFALFPIIGYFILEAVRNPKKIIFPVIGGVFFGILILTHNIMGVFFALLLFFLCISLLFMKRTQATKSIVILGVVGVLLSCYFWLPALYEKQFIALSQTPIADRNLYFVTLDQLVLPRWGFAPPTEKNGFSYQLGVSHIAALLMLVGVFAVGFSKKKTLVIKENAVILGFISSVILMLLLLFPFSAYVWEHIPLLKEINYPWTLLLPIGFLLCLAIGYLVHVHRGIRVILLCVAVLGIVTVLPYAKPEMFINRGDDFYMTNDATTTSSSEYMPLWVKKNPVMRPEKKAVISTHDPVVITSQSSQGLTFTVRTENPATATIQTIYYPGWEIRVNGSIVPISYANTGGVMEVSLPEGESVVSAVFHETPLRILSNLVSLITFVGITGYLAYTIVLKRLSVTNDLLKRKNND